MSEQYEPEVDDYVIWDRGDYGKDEGWVYFKGDKVDNEIRTKHGWNPLSRYITIETGVRPKPQHQLEDSSMHKYVHTLLLCYDSSWHQLKFVKKRTDVECQHYSQYDDVHGNEGVSMYKSQRHRYRDIQ